MKMAKPAKTKKIIFIPISAMWIEDNELFIRCKEGCGVYFIETLLGRLEFLASAFHPDDENGRVFRFMGIRE